ncbi:type II secretion system protein [Cerasicoccus frondis]|uniref:type II secretion system protein n=1 Tax=Cerasicoccus frondis TaxID=490090 RepID=UPI002852C2AA|nr:type II secretion system protein [Cerasicoccus frondis]
MPHKMHHARAGFSLVEILAALGIVAILVTILYPVIGNVITRSKIVETQSNMRQIAQSIDLYVIDHKGVYLSVGLGRNEEDPTKARTPWVQEMWAYIYPDRQWPGWAPADLDGTLFHSPFVDDTNAGARSYGMNVILEINHADRRYQYLPNPAAVALLGDVMTSSEFRPPQVNPRNDGKVSIVYLTGNVELLLPEDVPATASDTFWNGGAL